MVVSRLKYLYSLALSKGFIVKNESYSKFFIKAFVALGLILIFGTWFYSRFSFLYIEERVSCIIGGEFFLVDKKDKMLVRGNTYAYRAKGLSPYYEDGRLMGKFLMGMPGDKIEILSDHILINGLPKVYGFPHAEKLGKKPEDFFGKMELKNDQYWMLGNAPESFDSRYWGAISNEQIVGRLYTIY